MSPAALEFVHSLSAFWQDDAALVITSDIAGNLAVFEDVQAQGFAYYLPPLLKGAPVGMAALDGGGIVLTGARSVSSLYEHKTVVLLP